MKIRNGFVSNSSSSSFMIFGNLDNITCDVCKSVITSLKPDEYTADTYIKDYHGYNSLEEYREDRYNRDERIDKLYEDGGKMYMITIDQNDEAMHGVLGSILNKYNIDYEGEY